jgi:catechol 2,3-dioxygenase-like lactoylglutathione lyase family enzyme
VPAASFQDLCVDAVDADRLGAFWGEVLGLTPHRRDDGIVRLDGPGPQHRVWVNPVPEPVTVKQRVHLDVHAGSARDVLRLGATPLDVTSFPWQVLRDPEGGELCVFERERVPAYRLYEVVVDAVDPPRIAQWWADVLGARVSHEAEPGSGWSAVGAIPGAPFEALVFVPVPEPKTVKNRIHWDVVVPDLDLLTGDGARVLRRPDDDVSWTVLADPEGNEFCAFAPEED